MARNRDEELKNLVVESFNVAAEARKPMEKKWDEYYKLSRAIIGKPPRKWMTNYFVPYSPAIVDIVNSRLAARRVAGSIVGLNEDSQMRKEKFEQLILNQQEDLKVNLLFSTWAQESVRYGSSFLKVGWKQESAKDLPRTRSFLDKAKQWFSQLGMTVENEDFLYDGPTAEIIDLYDLFFHPQAKTIEDSRYVIHRSELSKDQILKNPNFTKNLDEIKKLSKGKQDIGEYRRDRLRSQGLTASQVNRISDSMNDDFFEVLEYRGLFDIDGDGVEEEVVATVVNRDIIVQAEESPYYLFKRPYVHLKFKTDPHFLYGISVLESVKDSQYMLNDIANQSGDMRKLTLQPLKKVKRSASLDLENLVIAPGVPIVLEDPNDLVFERPPDFTAQLEFMSKNIRQVMQIATGINDVVMGSEDVGVASDTLGGVQIAEEQATLRFRVPLLLMDEAIEDFTNKLIALNQQFFDRAREIKIFGGQGIMYQQIQPQDLSGKFSYRVEPMSTAARSDATRRAELVNVKQLFLEEPKIDQEKLDRMILEAFRIDPDTLIGNQQQLDQVAQLRQLPPEQLDAFLAKLPPQDQALMRRALSQAPQGAMNGQGQINPAESPAGQPTPTV